LLGYDTHVPMFFFGAGVAAGTYHTSYSPADIAPTLAAMLRVELPSNSVGNVLTEAIKMKWHL
jgi:arylsulfatase A-like enzyme